MRDRVRIIAEEVLAKNWGILKKYTFDLRRRDGQWQRQVRETYDRGPAAAVLLHCPETDNILLVSQFRFPLYAAGKDGWMLEVCAGLLDGDSPEACARREAEEEAGVRIKSLRHAFDADMSPGSVVERVSCFIGDYDAAARISAGGGLEAEGEDIEVIEIKVEDALRRIETGEITDAKTILLLHYLALRKQEAVSR